MNLKIDNHDLEKTIEALEQLTAQYKSVIDSPEYQLGKKVRLYCSLIKKGQIFVVLKKLFTRQKQVNAMLEYSIDKKDFSSCFSNKKIAVYTCVFGAYDKLQEPLLCPDNIEYFVITDQLIAQDSKWQVLNCEDIFPENVRSNVEKNRYIKMLPHKFFKEFDYSIYLDGNVWVTSDLTSCITSLEQFPIAMHQHKNRDCVYEEISACLLKKKDLPERLIEHKNLLEKDGLPRHTGLLEATVIARKHHDTQCVALMESWWNEFLQYSKRDQISLIHVLWTNKITIDTVASLGTNILKNDAFVIVPHS